MSRDHYSIGVRGGASVPTHLYSPSSRHIQSSSASHLLGHFSQDCSHPKRLCYIVQYISSALCFLYAICLPFLARASIQPQVVSAEHQHIMMIFTSMMDDKGFGRNMLMLFFIFQSLHQWCLASASRRSLKLLSVDIEYYEHNLLGVLAWVFQLCLHIARISLLYDVSLAHTNRQLNASIILSFLCCFFLLLVHLFYAYRGSLNSKVSAFISIVINLFVAWSLFHASQSGHLNPTSAVGMAIAFIAHAALLYPLMCIPSLQRWLFMLEGVQLCVCTVMFVCYQAFDNYQAK